MMILGRLENDLKWNYGVGLGRRPDLEEQYPLLSIWFFRLTRVAQDDEIGEMQKNSKGFYLRITLLGIKFDRRV